MEGQGANGTFGNASIHLIDSKNGKAEERERSTGRRAISLSKWYVLCFGWAREQWLHSQSCITSTLLLTKVNSLTVSAFYKSQLINVSKPQLLLYNCIFTFKHGVSSGVLHEGKVGNEFLGCSRHMSPKEETHCQRAHFEACVHHSLWKPDWFFIAHDSFCEVYDSSSKIFLSSGLLF